MSLLVDLFSCIFVSFYFKSNWHDLFSAHSSVTISKVIGRIYFQAYSSITISKVIGRIYFSCTFVSYYFKSNWHDLFSSIFVDYYFKYNWQDLLSAYSSITISKVIGNIYFKKIRQLLFQK